MKKLLMKRVAVAGNTVDGREIKAEHLQEMAETYNPNTYGARVWLEHIRGLFADSAFGALGDVISLSVQDDVINGETKTCLYAQIKPLPELIAINQKSQKIYTSVEIALNFAKTGKAYLMGLAVTDSPASLGTEALQFYTHRKQSQENILTAGVESEMEFTDSPDTVPPQSETALDEIHALFNQKTDVPPPAIENVPTLAVITDQFEKQQNLHSALENKVSQHQSTMVSALTKLAARVDALVMQIETETTNLNRSPHDGNAAPTELQADF